MMYAKVILVSVLIYSVTSQRISNPFLTNTIVVRKFNQNPFLSKQVGSSSTGVLSKQVANSNPFLTNQVDTRKSPIALPTIPNPSFGVAESKAVNNINPFLTNQVNHQNPSNNFNPAQNQNIPVRNYPSYNTFTYGQNPSPQVPQVYNPAPPVILPSNDNLDQLKRVCGLVGSSVSLIKNGLAANQSDYPWIAALFKRETGFICSATLISKTHALTAAHCVDGVRPSKLSIVLGREDINGESNVGKQVPIFDFRVHGDYETGESSDSDIAILILDQDVNFSPTIRPICLPAVTSLGEVVGIEGVVVGWGLTENGTYPSKPRKVGVPIVSEVECLRSHHIFNTITSNRTFCAGNKNGSSPCNGDSGSGMAIEENGRWSIRGIVSKSPSLDDGSRTCDPYQYTVFVDVAKYMGWILKYIQS